MPRKNHNKDKELVTERKVNKETVTNLCRKYSVPATRQLVNRVLGGEMSDGDLIKAVTTINDRAFGKVVAPVEMTHTIDMSDEHLKALQGYAKARLNGEEPEIIDITPQLEQKAG